MSERNAKMLRRVNKDSKAGKKEWNSFTQYDRAMLRLDYIDRGAEARKQYTKAKKLARQERIGE